MLKKIDNCYNKVKYVRPCKISLVERQLGLAVPALKLLRNTGFTIEQIKLDGYTRPTVTVSYDGYCRKKQEKGEAVKYAQGIDERGPYEKYQMYLSNCRVNWEVR